MKKFSFPTSLVIALILSWSLSSQAQEKVKKADDVLKIAFAQVNQTSIAEVQLKEFIAQQKRGSFYHGKPPEGSEADFIKETEALLIEQFLLAQAARKVGLTASKESIEQQVLAYDQQFESSEQWQAIRENYLPLYQQLLEVKDLAKQYQAFIKNSVSLSTEQVQNYYRSNADKFTQPPQNQVGIILISVSPSAGGFVWQAVEEQIANIHGKLLKGADFSELAQLHSTDVTADQGGDMGFAHEGMIAKKVETLLVELSPGDITEPVILLEGIAIFKLIDRKPAINHDFSEVKERANALALNDAKTQIWQETLTKLKNKAVINVHKSNVEPG